MVDLSTQVIPAGQVDRSMECLDNTAVYLPHLEALTRPLLIRESKCLWRHGLVCAASVFTLHRASYGSKVVRDSSQAFHVRTDQLCGRHVRLGAPCSTRRWAEYMEGRTVTDTMHQHHARTHTPPRQFVHHLYLPKCVHPSGGF